MFVASEVYGQAVALSALTEGLADGALKTSLQGIVSTLEALAASLASLDSARRLQRDTIGRNFNVIYFSKYFIP